VSYLTKIGLLASGHVGDLESLLFQSRLPFETFAIEDQGRRPIQGALQRAKILHPFYWQVRALREWINERKVTHLLSLDNNPIISHLQGLDRLPVFVVQHGMRQLRDPIASPPPIAENLTFLSWGSIAMSECDANRLAHWPNSLYRVKPSVVTAVGSLRDSLAEQSFRTRTACDSLVSSPAQNQVCLISQFKGESPKELLYWEDRQNGLALLTSWVGRYVRSRGLPLVVAGYADTPETMASESRWFKQHLNCEFELRSPRTLTSTYEMTQGSRVSVGMHSSSLWEAFGRGCRILSVNPTNQTSFDFPVSGRWSTERSTYEEFSEKMDAAMHTSDDIYESDAKQTRRQVCVWSPDESVGSRIISEILAKGDVG